MTIVMSWFYGVGGQTTVFRQKPLLAIRVGFSRARTGRVRDNNQWEKGKEKNVNEQQTTQEVPPGGTGPGAWQDMMGRLKAGEREMILAAVACGLALLQALIGATGGALLTTAMLLNLSLIGWLGNTAHARRNAGQGNGLLLLTGIAFALAALSTLFLAEAVTSVVNTVQVFESFDY